MKINLNRKNKIIAGISVIVVCSVLITAGVFTLVNKSKVESSAEALEKNKISNLFNIRQAEDDLDDESSSSSRTLSTSSSSTVRENTSSNNTSSSTTRKNTQTSNKRAATTTTTQIPSATATPTTPQPVTQAPTTVNKDEGSNGSGSTVTTLPVVDTKPTEEPTTTNPLPVAENNISSAHKIIINNSIKGHTYKAYQIFQGDLAKKDSVNVLSNVKWGNQFEKYGEQIISELKTYYEKTSEDKETFKNCKTAAELADILSKHNELANQFTVIIGKVISNDKEIKEDSSATNYPHIIPLDNPGYYMVIDTDLNLENDSLSKYLLDVANEEIEMEVKSIKPDLNKTISGGSEIDETHNTSTYYPSTYKVNDEVPYEINFALKARIPTNQEGTYGTDKYKEFLSEYNNYQYDIIDIVDNGFDLKTVTDEDNSPVVFSVQNKDGMEINSVQKEDGTVVNINEYYEFSYIDASDANIERYKLSEDMNYTGKKIFKISLNVQKLVNDGIMLPGDIIVFNYDAKLNKNHISGSKANINLSYAVYSSDPYNEGTFTKTSNSRTYTYAIPLNILKIAQNDINSHLPDAEFEIYKKNESNTSLIDTIITSSEDDETKGYATYRSLSAGEYQIRETKAPIGYSKLNEDIKLTISIKSIDPNTNDAEWEFEIEKNSLVEKAEEPSSTVNLVVANKSGVQLPITGGMGTVIFTVVGLGIMGLAVVALKSNKKEN